MRFKYLIVSMSQLSKREHFALKITMESMSQYPQIIMTEFDIANQLARITLLSSIQFERELLSLLDSPHLIPVLSDLLASNFKDCQKQLAAVAINKAITHRLDANYKEWNIIWAEYLQHLLKNPQIDKIQWRHLLITGKSLQKLMQQFEEKYCDIINPIFANLNYKCKALIYDSFLYVESSEETKYVFVRETIQNFLGHTLDFISEYHDSHQRDKDALKLEKCVIENLDALINNLSNYNEGFIYDMTIKISINMELFLVIVQQLLFDHKNRNHECVIKKDFSPERMNELILFTDDDEINSLKAKTLKIYSSLLCQYDLKSGIEEFDQYKYLYFMEHLIPIAIDNLITLAKTPQKYVQNEDIIIALLNFLCRSCKFNFMLQTFQNVFEKIFYQICVPLLMTTQEERQYFTSDYAGFIKISQQLYQSHEDQSQTIKNSSGKFIQALSHIIHGSLLFIVQNSIQTIRSILLNEQLPQIQQAIQLHNYKPSIDTSLILLSLFSSHYLHREDLYIIIKTKFLSIPQLLQFRELQKARLLIFLAYNYEKLYKNNPEDGSHFLVYADSGLNEISCISQCSLIVFQNCLKVGFGNDIWQNFIMRIEDTNIINVFKLLNQILEKMLDDLPLEKVDELIGKLIQRLIKQFRKCSDEAKQKSIKGNQFLYRCLDIIESIVKNQKYLKQQGRVIQSIWPIFDLFQFSERIEFEDNILLIFNKILAVEKHLTHRHFVFVPYFQKIYEKQNGFVDLIETITFLITKGREYLLTEQQGKIDLLKLMDFVKGCYGMMKNEDTLKHILVFFHYIYLEYSSVLQFKREFIDKLLEIYDIQKQMMKDETKASIINFLLITKYKFGCCDLQIIKENRIEIFQGYQAKIFAFGLRNIIEKEQQSEQVLNYLRYSIRLLHYIRSVNLKQQPERHRYYEPNFPEITSIDPFNEICLSLNFVKRSFQPKRYDMILEELNSEISLGQIKDLLSRRIIDNSLRTIKRVKHQ